MPLPPETHRVPIGDDGLIPLGTMIDAPAANVAEALEGYIFKVNFATSRGIAQREIRFTGQASEKGLQAMVVGPVDKP